MIYYITAVAINVFQFEHMLSSFQKLKPSHELLSIMPSYLYIICTLLYFNYTFKICIFRQHFFVNANFIKHN